MSLNKPVMASSTPTAPNVDALAVIRGEYGNEKQAVSQGELLSNAKTRKRTAIVSRKISQGDNGYALGGRPLHTSGAFNIFAITHLQKTLSPKTVHNCSSTPRSSRRLPSPRHIKDEIGMDPSPYTEFPL